ncbi:MAG TPA: hypothetical protein VFB24_13090, partial [Candidatus Binatia bacterium]|nr:hypothetical protein [Candidatus Binatia bacterium]
VRGSRGQLVSQGVELRDGGLVGHGEQFRLQHGLAATICPEIRLRVRGAIDLRPRKERFAIEPNKFFAVFAGQQGSIGGQQKAQTCTMESA